MRGKKSDIIVGNIPDNLDEMELLNLFRGLNDFVTHRFYLNDARIRECVLSFSSIQVAQEAIKILKESKSFETLTAGIRIREKFDTSKAKTKVLDTCDLYVQRIPKIISDTNSLADFLGKNNIKFKEIRDFDSQGHCAILTCNSAKEASDSRKGLREQGHFVNYIKEEDVLNDDKLGLEEDGNPGTFPANSTFKDSGYESKTKSTGSASTSLDVIE